MEEPHSTSPASATARVPATLPTSSNGMSTEISQLRVSRPSPMPPRRPPSHLPPLVPLFRKPPGSSTPLRLRDRTFMPPSSLRVPSIPPLPAVVMAALGACPVREAKVRIAALANVPASRWLLASCWDYRVFMPRAENARTQHCRIPSSCSRTSADADLI